MCHLSNTDFRCPPKRIHIRVPDSFGSSLAIDSCGKCAPMPGLFDHQQELSEEFPTHVLQGRAQGEIRLGKGFIFF